MLRQVPAIAVSEREELRMRLKPEIEAIQFKQTLIYFFFFNTAKMRNFKKERKRKGLKVNPL